MRRFLIISSLFPLALAVFWGACADRKALTLVKTHLDEWNIKTSAEFHGRKIEQVGLISCSACHGSDYRGGTSEVSCYQCHNGPSGHPEGFLSPSSSSYHGLRVARSGPAVCATCHGEDYKGLDNKGVSCYQCHNGPSGHPTGWLDSSSDNYHGLEVARTGAAGCAACHGDDYLGGTSGVSCYTCHNGPSGHPTGWLDSSSDSYHGLEVARTGTSECAACHGDDYRGGTSEVSCYTCHNGPSGHPTAGWFDRASANYHGLKAATEGKEACAPCHGNDYKGGTSGVSCFTCHNGPSGHPTGWFDRTSNYYHGKRVEDNGAAICAPCHGEDYMGGIAGISCYTCHDGPEDLQ